MPPRKLKLQVNKPYTLQSTLDPIHYTLHVNLLRVVYPVCNMHLLMSLPIKNGTFKNTVHSVSLFLTKNEASDR